MKNWMMIGVVAAALLAAGGGTVRSEENPAAPGFNAAGSDAKAIALADRVMEAMGGRKAWDRTRFITWKFFGRRLHVWDKHTGNIRVERDDDVVLMNLNTKEGRAWDGGVEVTHADSLEKRLRGAEGAWINDAYWLVMPYKMKDSGVTLTYLGEGEDPNGNACEIVEMTFENVGRTPQNKYNVYISKDTGLVTHWIYWRDKSVDESRDLGPWANWRKMGDIMMTDDHGERKHTDVAVLTDLPASVFTDPAPFNLDDYR